MSASAGRVLIIPRGEYDGTVEYKMLDLVTYQNGSYLAKQTTTGNLPTDTTYWQEMITTPDMTGASAGAAGVHGLVPAPSAGDQGKYLKGDGTWATVDLSSKADQTIISDSYNAATTYGPIGNANNYPSWCIDGNVLYKNISQCVGVQPPNVTYWEATDVTSELSALNNSLTEVLVDSSSGYLRYEKKGNVKTLTFNSFSISALSLPSLLANCDGFPSFMIETLALCNYNSSYITARVVISADGTLSVQTIGSSLTTITTGRIFLTVTYL